MFPIRRVERIAHLEFMAKWWAGEVLDLSQQPMVDVADPKKLAKVQAELASLRN